MAFNRFTNALKRELDLMTIVQSLVAYSILLFFLIAPLVTMVSRAFLDNGKFSLNWFINLLNSPEYVSLTPRGGRLFQVYRGTMYIWGYDHGILLNSLIVAFSVTILCSIIGVVLQCLWDDIILGVKKSLESYCLYPS